MFMFIPDPGSRIRDPGSGMRIRDPYFISSRILIVSISDPQQSILTLKKAQKNRF